MMQEEENEVGGLTWNEPSYQPYFMKPAVYTAMQYDQVQPTMS